MRLDRGAPVPSCWWCSDRILLLTWGREMSVLMGSGGLAFLVVEWEIFAFLRHSHAPPAFIRGDNEATVLMEGV